MTRRRHPAGREAADPDAVRQIMQRQRARKMIAEALPDLTTAYQTAATMRAMLADAIMEERLRPVEAAAFDMLLEEVVARAHAEGAEWAFGELEARLRATLTENTQNQRSPEEHA